jgi:hypothetical protein
MTQQARVKLLAIVYEHRHIALEELVNSLPDLTWNQVFCMVDELSRRQLISLRRREFDYELQTCSVPA